MSNKIIHALREPSMSSVCFFWVVMWDILGWNLDIIVVRQFDNFEHMVCDVIKSVVSKRYF